MAVVVKSKPGKVVTMAAGGKTFHGKITAEWKGNQKFDVDISAIMRDARGEAQALCYYDDLTPFPGIEHSPDVQDGGVEFIKMALDGGFQYPIVDLFADIDHGVEYGLNWAMIDSCKITVEDEDTHAKIEIEPGMDLMAGGEVSMWIARFYMDGGAWKMVEVSNKFDPTNTNIQAFADKMLPTAS